MAKEADAVIAVVGLNADWETEGYDRTTLALPGRTDELVSKVAAANPKTIVVTQSVCDLSPVELDDDSQLCFVLGFFDYVAMGGFSCCPSSRMVSRELNWRCHRGRSIRETQPVWKVVFDVPEGLR